MVFALLLPVLLGMVALAVDLGGLASDRRSLQNAADAIALAAGQDLPDADAAQASAQSWATKNGIDAGQLTVTVSGGNTAPKVTVVLQRTHSFSFAKAIGIPSSDVTARAAASKVTPAAVPGVVPWGITQATVDASPSGSQVILKYDASGGSVSGNYGAISVDGHGASTYRDGIKFGSSSTICSQAQANCAPAGCPGTFPSACGETSPVCDGYDCDSEPGNMTGPTRTGVDYRMNNTSAACDSFAEAFTPDTGAKYRLNGACNPWAAGACPVPDTGAACSRRVIVIPVIDGFSNGRKPVQILGFALVFLEGYDGTKCSGNDCQIKGRFVKADVTMNTFTGAYDPNANLQTVRLSE